MQLTRYSDYSLRALFSLAASPTPRATIEEIATAYGISHAHLMKVVRHLRALGLLETVRGRHGGLQLAVAPERVNVGPVIRWTEENLALVDCLRDDGACAIAPARALRRALGEALGAFLAVLDRYTLADLVARRREPLAALLALAPE